MGRPTRPDKNDPIVCCCNEVRASAIRQAMEQGAGTLAGIFDATWAGCGPCGGSCQPELVEMLRDHLARQAGRQPEET